MNMLSSKARAFLELFGQCGTKRSGQSPTGHLRRIKYFVCIIYYRTRVGGHFLPVKTN